MKCFTIPLLLIFFYACSQPNQKPIIRTDTIFVEKIVRDTVFIVKEKKEQEDAFVSLYSTKANRLIVGVSNPVLLETNFPYDSIFFETGDNASIRKDDYSANLYDIRVKKAGKVQIWVKAKINGKLKRIKTFKFYTYSYPTPKPKVNNQNQGAISKNVLLAQAGISASSCYAGHCLHFIIQQFTVSTWNESGVFVEKRSDSYRFTPEQKELFINLKSGDKVIVDNIKAKGPEGKIRLLSPIVLTIK